MSNSFQELGCVKIDSLLDIQTVDVVSKYLENKIRRGEWKETLNNDDSSRYGYYSDPLIEVLLLECLPAVEKVTELELEPTYTYARVYQGGEELRPHKDRPACEISTTINIATKGDISPIWMQYADYDPIKILLSPGDAVIYKGCEATHWRTKLAKDVINVQIMLHYVDKNGANAGYKFDGRKSTGCSNRIV
jgi:hypothetical protein